MTRSVLYIGVTNNLESRLQQHRQGEHPGFTRRYHATRLVYYEHFSHILEALDREKQLKGWRRAKKDALVMSTDPRWEDLSADWSIAPVPGATSRNGPESNTPDERRPKQVRPRVEGA